MPRLKLMSVPLRIGSDDLSLPSSIELLVTIVWLLVVLSVLHNSRPADLCTEGSTVDGHFQAGIILAILKILVAGSTVKASLRGSVINPWPRRNIPRLILCRAVLEVACLVFVARATIKLSSGSAGCEPQILAVMFRLVKLTWFLCICSVVGFLFLLIPDQLSRNDQDYNPPSDPSTPDSDISDGGSFHGRFRNLERSESISSQTTRNTRLRFHSVLKFLKLEDNPAMVVLSKHLARFRKEEVDIVASDVLVALIKLADEQETRLTYIRQEINSDKQLHKVRPEPWMNESMAHHFLRYAAGCYGWPYFCMKSLFAALGLLRVLCRSRFFPRPLPENIIEDNRFLANTAVIKMTTGLCDEDIVYITYHNKLFQVPFFIAIDHTHQAIVVTIRGSFSLEDILTDLTAYASDPVGVPGHADMVTHHGILLAAQYHVGQLVGMEATRAGLCTWEDVGDRTQPLLDRAWQQLSDQVGNTKAQRYGLVITGHSLGAGVAAVLALLMRQLPKYKNLKCFAYSPPGGLMSVSASRYVQKFVCSVVLGDDICARISIPSIYDLKIRIFQIIRDCDIPKHRVVGSWLEKYMRQIVRGATPGYQPHKGQSWGEDRVIHKHVEKFQMEMQRAIHSSQYIKARYPFMHLPGCVMFIDVTHHKRWFGSSESYNVVWTDGMSPLFEEVVLTPYMIAHHVQWNVLSALQTFLK